MMHLLEDELEIDRILIFLFFFLCTEHALHKKNCNAYNFKDPSPIYKEMNLQNVILLVSFPSKTTHDFSPEEEGGRQQRLGGRSRRRDGRVLSWSWVGKLGFYSLPTRSLAALFIAYVDGLVLPSTPFKLLQRQHCLARFRIQTK